MKFSLTGSVWYDPKGTIRTITWEDGDITGDPVALRSLDAYLGMIDCVSTPDGLWGECGNLKDIPLAAYLLMQSVMGWSGFADGDIPVMPDCPVGGVC